MAMLVDPQRMVQASKQTDILHMIRQDCKDKLTAILYNYLRSLYPFAIDLLDVHSAGNHSWEVRQD